MCLLCQSAEHHACHGRVEEHFACFDQALEIAAHAPVPPEPSQCSLHHPPALEHVKATRDLWGLLAWGEPHAVQTRPPVFADRQRPAQRRGKPGLQALIRAVGPEQRNARELRREACEQQLGAAPVVDVGPVHAGLEQIAFGVHEDVPLAAGDLLGAVVAARAEAAKVPPAQPVESCRRAPASVVRTDWLSMIAAVGWGLRPLSTRWRSRRAVLIRSQVP